MNAYLIAACALIVSLVPPAVVCARGRPIEGAIALQFCATTSTLTLLCLSVGFFGPTYVVVAVIAAALAPVNGLVTARMLGHDV
ncbi:MAG: hypothetical protein ACRDM1_00660 [Gaiellaceae bacterium]